MSVLKEKTNSKKALQIPEHIAIIMDGNRRWAKNNGKISTLGHREGVRTLKKIVRYCNDIGVKHLTVYAFSTENWKRKKDEVEFLMSLFIEVLKNEIDEMDEENVRIGFLGFLEDLPNPLPELMKESKEKLSKNTGINFNIAINYGSRAEITNSVKEIAKKLKAGSIDIKDIDEKLISDNLLTKETPDPDLLIRTGGEFRISNYLLWQSAYSEFYSTEKMWPEFTVEELDKAINEYQNRHRRYGV